MRPMTFFPTLEFATEREKYSETLITPVKTPVATFSDIWLTAFTLTIAIIRFSDVKQELVTNLF